MGRRERGELFFEGPPGDWTLQASCRGLGAGLLDFFAEEREDWKACKQVCKSCPVKQECLSYALKTRSVYGVWGGLDQRELRHALGLAATGNVWTYAEKEVKCPLCQKPTQRANVPAPGIVRRWCLDCDFGWLRAERGARTTRNIPTRNQAVR